MSREMSARTTDLVGAALALGLAAYALSETGEMSELGAVFPTTASIVLILAGIGLAVRAVFATPAQEPQGRVEWLRWAGIGVILVAWALLLKPLGFLLSAAIGMIAVGLVTYRERMSLLSIALHLLAGGALLGLFYGLFRFVLKVPLP